MPNRLYDTLVFLLRGQPVHNAHAEIMQRASALARQVIVIIGSTQQARTYKNPFTGDERAQMIRNVVGAMNATVIIEQNTDTIYNDQAWAARVQAIVGKHTKSTDSIGIIGHKKDDSTTEYLNMFPQWGFAQVKLIEPLDATNVRDLYFRRGANLKFISAVVPKGTLMFLEQFMLTPEYEQIIREREFIVAHNKPYASLPYPPIFVTVDAVVVCAGHVLMIKRRAEPGKGLWAMPGGYVNAYTDKNMQTAMIRELREETGIKIPGPVLLGSIKKVQILDAVERSPRGRIISHCYTIELDVPANGELPKVKGMDDAEKAKWIPIADLDSKLCFEDHYEAIQMAVATVRN